MNFKVNLRKTFSLRNEPCAVTLYFGSPTGNNKRDKGGDGYAVNPFRKSLR